MLPDLSFFAQPLQDIFLSLLSRFQGREKPGKQRSLEVGTRLNRYNKHRFYWRFHGNFS
ncbi:MAG: hypothetical protein HC890_07080 [Chloroflexaceae bacterium]|nr:hypothetical protein [Chloroflexaceae bacterium]